MATADTALELQLEARPRISPGRRLAIIAWRNPLGVLGAMIVLLIAVGALFADWIAPYGPASTEFAAFIGPSQDHLFGTDNLGRDVFSRVVHGARISLGVGVISISVGSAAGAAIGIFSGYFGGRMDNAIQRTGETIMAFPALILLLIIVSILGPDIKNVIIAISLGVIPGIQRIVRGAVLSEKQNQYVEAARALGASNLHIMFRHILPNVLALIIILATLLLGGVILIEAGLSFLGLGVPPPNPSWGADLSGEARTYFLDPPGAWWMAVFPGIAISVTVLGFNLLGDTLRDILDPRLRGRI